MKTIKVFILLLIVFFSLTPIVSASDDTPKSAEAQVLRILDQKETIRDNGSKSIQQNLELGILSGPLKGRTEQYIGISGLDVVSSNVYQKNDRVLLSYNRNEGGEYIFYVTDYVRNRSLIYLAIVFVLAVLLVGGVKGLKAILSLVVSFLAIVKILIPLVFAGYNPLVVGIFVSMIILLAIIYFTEGWNRKSHLAVISIAIALVFTSGLVLFFGHLSRLSGTSQEEVIFLMDAVKTPINFYYLLLASIMIGTLGVLDDIVIGQIESVEQIKKANPNLNDRQVFKMAMQIGRAHLGAIINTLFLAYAGASLPLVLLFSVHQEPFLSFSQVVNHEDIATEIVRTLVGAISLCLSAPIATFLAVKKLKNK